MELITLKDDAKRLVTGPVAIPDCPDCDYPRGEKLLTVDEIESMVHFYNTTSQLSDEMHVYGATKQSVGVAVENWTLKEPLTTRNTQGNQVTLPRGTWMTTIKVTDDETWQKIQDGTYKGFSASYMSRDAAEEVLAAKRTLIADLEDPMPVTVSIVDEPCVFDALFCSIKQQDSFEDIRERLSQAVRQKLPLKEAWVTQTFPDKVIVEIWEDGNSYFEIPYTMNGEEVVLGEPVEVEIEYVAKILVEAKKAGRKISNATLKKITDAFETMKTLINDALTERGETEADKNVLEDIDMDEEQLTKLVREAVKAELESQRQEPEPGAEEEVEEETIEESEPEPTEAEKQLAEAQAEIESLKKKLGEGESQKIEGQDEEKPEAHKDRALKFEFEDRDAFGCKIHKE